jgi:hypothetical protein
VKPTERPRMVLSEMGRRILDLRDRGFSNPQIARHVGCHHEVIRQLVEDPRKQPRYTTGQEIIRLHENVMTGMSGWGRMVMALIGHGFTKPQIAVRIGMNETQIYAAIKDPAWVPTYAIGERLHNLYRRHVGNQLEKV